MNNQLVSIVATVVGPDRTGLVEILSNAISKNDGNWEESRMAHLSGQFAGMLRIELPEEKIPDLESDFRALSDEGLQVSMTRGTGKDAGSEERKSCTMVLVSHDRPGIVSEVSGILAGHGLNVEEFKSLCESAPMSGEILFRAEARLTGPGDLDIDEVRTGLEGLGSDFMVEIEEGD